MAKRYGNSVNQRPAKFNDEIRSQKDFSQRDFFQNESAAMGFEGMPTSMRGGLEREMQPMLREDHRAIANLPQEVMIKPYPQTGPYMPEILNDTQRAVNAQMDYDDKQRRSNFYPKKV